jgi:hypothetical protein
MSTSSESPEAHGDVSCSGCCQAAEEEKSKTTFGLRGTIIAGSLGLALSGCESSPPPPSPLMTVLYGPAPMMKQSSPNGSSANAVKGKSNQ